MNLKEQLLQSTDLTPVHVTLLGCEYRIKRLTAAQLSQHDKYVRQYQSDSNVEQLNLVAAQMILDSILDEKGLPMAKSVKASELMDVHTPLAINSAVSELIKVNYLSDDAEVTAKKD